MNIKKMELYINKNKKAFENGELYLRRFSNELSQREKEKSGYERLLTDVISVKDLMDKREFSSDEISEINKLNGYMSFKDVQTDYVFKSINALLEVNEFPTNREYEEIYVLNKLPKEQRVKFADRNLITRIEHSLHLQMVGLDKYLDTVMDLKRLVPLIEKLKGMEDELFEYAPRLYTIKTVFSDDVEKLGEFGESIEKLLEFISIMKLDDIKVDKKEIESKIREQTRKEVAKQLKEDLVCPWDTETFKGVGEDRDLDLIIEEYTYNKLVNCLDK